MNRKIVLSYPAYYDIILHYYIFVLFQVLLLYRKIIAEVNEAFIMIRSEFYLIMFVGISSHIQYLDE